MSKRFSVKASTQKPRRNINRRTSVKANTKKNFRVTASTNKKKVTGKSWQEFVKNVESQTDYKVDSAFKRSYDKWIELLKDGKSYDAEVTKYSDGSYELMLSNVSVKAASSTKKFKVQASRNSKLRHSNKVTAKTNLKKRFRITASVDNSDDILDMDQEFSSAKTAVNGKYGKLPAVFKKVSFPRGAKVLDYGGGTVESEHVAQSYLDQFEATELLYDTFNQTAEHNREVVRQCRENGGADIAICSNVLNVIKEPEVRLNVLENIKRLTKPGGSVYISVYEGAKDKPEGPTKSGYQLNRKTADYLEEIQQVFPDATRRGKLISAVNASTSMDSSKRITAANEYEIEQMMVKLGEMQSDFWTRIEELVEDLEDIGLIVNDYNLEYIDASYEDSDTDEDVYLIIRLNVAGSTITISSVEESERIGAATEIRGDTMLPGPGDYDPPEYDEPKLVDEIAEVEIDFDCNIIICEDGSWDYEDPKCSWADGPGSFGDWYSDEYDVYLGDNGSMVEYIDELLESKLPDVPGIYRISGLAELVFNISDIEKYADKYEWDDQYIADRAKVEFNFTDSYIEGFDFELVGSAPVDTIESSTSVKAASNQFDRSFQVYHGRTKFIVHIKDESDPLFFTMQITEIHPYDNAEYTWANVNSNHTVQFIRDGKIQDKMKLDEFADDEEYYMNFGEYLDTQIDTICTELLTMNRDVKSQIDHT